MGSTELVQAARILKWLNGNLQLGEASLKYLEKNMLQQYSLPNWNQGELNLLRVTMYCTVNSMLIWYNSFEKEFLAGFRTAAIAYDKTNFIELNKVCKSYFNVIREIFPNLNDIRNTILAHGYRWNDKTFLNDHEIDTFMNEITNRGSLLEYYQLSNISNLVFKEIEKVHGEINAELNVDESDKFEE
ncbi:hypothetical protein [Chitinophaga sp. sic0106]|uniref:hypothetical protein n=1 Tax=Chitinophaga sp. sic0106 TaxID=2854785 RepID=UPI001C48E1CF|nr:hypothetical protein [Chitinophaga sp. sic0106]MBV7530477.1 hypothetical protein [Chitinophaga sp. sic0106]